MTEREESEIEFLRSHPEIVAGLELSEPEIVRLARDVQERPAAAGGVVEVSRSSEPIAEAVSAEFELWEELLAELGEQGQQRGKIRDEATPRAIAGTLVSGWEGALMRARPAKDVEPLRAFVAFVLDGLVMRPSEANR